jgi:glycosyltransferase involved in cell wall biosynthesis
MMTAPIDTDFMSGSAADEQRRADVSFIMPCFNEQEMVGYTITRLVAAFRRAGYKLELVAVDNGSSDRTGALIQTFVHEYPGLVKFHRVDVNQGYGHGILSGAPYCTAPWIGIIPADGQVDAEDAVRLYDTVATTDGRVVGKVRRRFRMDGWRRKAVSIAFNCFMWLLWPGLGSLDVNGNPRILRREYLLAMNLRSKNWLLDAEIMVKSQYLGLRVHEVNVFARMRSNGVSHIRAATCWEFFSNLVRARVSDHWRRELESAPLDLEPTRLARQ